MEEGWLYFLMGWISVAPMVLPGHCLLPTVWLGGRWQQSSLHSRRGPYGPMWSLRFCFLWQMSCCDSGMVLRTRVTRVMTRENVQDSPRWYPSPVHQSDYKVTNMTKWRHFVPSVPGVSSRQGADPAGMWPSQVSQLRCWVCLCWWSDGSTGIQSSWDWPWGRRSEEIQGDLRRSEGKIMASLSTFCRLLLHARSCWLCGI